MAPAPALKHRTEESGKAFSCVHKAAAAHRQLLRTSRLPWSSYCSSVLESHSPPLAPGLHRLYQAFTQHRKVLQDCLYVGHHHKLPTSRHHHASLYAGGLKNQRISLSGVSQKHKVGGSVDRYMSPDMYLTQGHTEMRICREPRAYTQQCVESLVSIP